MFKYIFSASVCCSLNKSFTNGIPSVKKIFTSLTALAFWPLHFGVTAPVSLNISNIFCCLLISIIE